MENKLYTVWFAEDVTDWSDFIVNVVKVKRSRNCTVHSQALSELCVPPSHAQLRRFEKAQAHVVILSPKFLQFMTDNPSIIIGKLLDRSRVVAILCGVHEADIESIHRANLVWFDNWKKITVVDNDQNICNSLFSNIAEIEKNIPSEESIQLPSAFKLNPCKAREGCSKITIELQQPISEKDHICAAVQTEYETIPLSVKYYNPYTVKFVLPDRFFGASQIVYIHVSCGTELLGYRPLKCESKMAELNNLLASVLNPRSFMCETLGLADRNEDLDLILVSAFKKNILKNGFNLLEFSQDAVKQRDEELPTLLHFAAKYGMKELCAAILDCPGVGSACRVRNLRGLTPADIAEKEGHLCLANMLDNYSRLSETAEIYIYMKGMTEDVASVDYENLRARFRESLEYATNCLGDVSSSDCATHEKQCASAENASNAKKVTAAPRMNVSKPSLLQRAEEMAEVSPPGLTTIARDVERLLQIHEQQSSSKCSDIKMYPESQQELIHLLEDFKQEKYNINEVELLFHNWKLRRENAGSFYEKQEQLKNMRQQYEQIQSKCQEKTKKKSAVERFRCFLNLNVKKEQISSASDQANVVCVREKSKGSESSTPGIEAVCCRPPSTWSYGSNSSTSSDRFSTVSALSISSATSDSGALSDIGEEQQPHLLVSPVMINPEYMMTYESMQSAPKPAPPKPPLKPPKTTLKSNLSPDAVKNRKPVPPPRNILGIDDKDGVLVKGSPQDLTNTLASQSLGLDATSIVSPNDGYMRMDNSPFGVTCRSPKSGSSPLARKTEYSDVSSEGGNRVHLLLGAKNSMTNV